MSDITRREFLKYSSLGALGAIGVGSKLFCTRVQAKKPNFVFFLTDDQRWDGMSCAGNEILQTPNMDRIAAAGVRFENMFVTTSLCGPSRASILTGLYSHNHGLRRNGMALAAEHKTFPEILKENGYQTAFIGKWHNTDLGKDRSFDYSFGFKGQGKYYDPVISENYGPEQEYKGHVTDILADKAVEYLKEAHQEPFCLLLWFKAPHRSFLPAERFKDLYKDVTIPKPETWDDDYATRPDAVKNVNMRIGDFEDVPDFDTFTKDYYRCLAGVDENVGKVLDVLEKSGLDQDTVVIYSGDNGFFIGEHHWFDKRFMYEESIRVPLLVRYPELIKPGRIAQEMVLNVDFGPSIIDLAGIKVPEIMDGASFKPLLQGEKAVWRKDFLYEYYEYPGPHSGRKCRGIRTEQWKYIHFFEDPQEFELYDLQNDPNEINNLINNPEYFQIVEKLQERLNILRRELNDPDI